jgi:hypothetical protein
MSYEFTFKGEKRVLSDETMERIEKLMEKYARLDEENKKTRAEMKELELKLRDSPCDATQIMGEEIAEDDALEELQKAGDV